MQVVRFVWRMHHTLVVGDAAPNGWNGYPNLSCFDHPNGFTNRYEF